MKLSSAYNADGCSRRGRSLSLAGFIRRCSREQRDKGASKRHRETFSRRTSETRRITEFSAFSLVVSIVSVTIRLFLFWRLERLVFSVLQRKKRKGGERKVTSVYVLNFQDRGGEPWRVSRFPMTHKEKRNNIRYKNIEIDSDIFRI